MAIAPVLKTPREILRDDLLEGLEAKKQKLYSGPMEGQEIVLWEDVRELFWQRMPPTSDHGAEVATPGRVVVFAVCPRCSQSAPIALEVTPELRVDTSAGHLHLKGKSKPVTHVCGQLRADLRTDGQDSFELEDIIGDVEAIATDGADDLDAPPEGAVDGPDDDSDALVLADMDDGMPGLACDWPRCRLSAGHSGPHKMPVGRPPKLPVDDAEDDSEPDDAA
jgi:hypothetical protein